eukprot:TRINITY_DN14696_c0_g1_i2.p1 TRINITY_DN14696_c0_g1~~TRINITY_DN14696_c0_g1_i2.p1  ORF type:complete len:773 (+),score=87.23 TRINITY_DN14696_c0_g1_i2:70-2388(+)
MRRPLLLLLLSTCPTCVCAGGGQKLWELGTEVEANPLTVFSMFCFTVFLTVVVEVTKHSIEHRTHDHWRKQALQAIYAELMMVGIVSFFLIMGAELGLTDLRIDFGDCGGSGSAAGNQSAVSGAAANGSSSSSGSADTDPAPTSSASGSGSDSAVAAAAASSTSGSGSECGLGFDILMFEYAHLVLFFMGLTYCAFIQIAFWMRDRMCAVIADVQREQSLCGWYADASAGLTLAGALGFQRKSWARAVLGLRAIMCLEHGPKFKYMCTEREEILERSLAKLRYEPVPTSLGVWPRDAVVHHFDMARFAKLAMSEVLVELLHVPPVVWMAVAVMSTSNLVHRYGVDLADAVAFTAPLGPLLGFFLLAQLKAQLNDVVCGGIGHTDCPTVDFWNVKKGAGAGDNAKAVEPLVSRWSPPNAKRGKDGQEGGDGPWEGLQGCVEDGSTFDCLDPLDPGAIAIQIQVVIFACCFFVGQLIMLIHLIVDHRGFLLLLVLWAIPAVPLCDNIPRALLIYALTHRSKDPPRRWLRYSLILADDEDEGHGHGHGHSAHDPDQIERDIEESDREVIADMLKRRGAGWVSGQVRAGDPYRAPLELHGIVRSKADDRNENAGTPVGHSPVGGSGFSMSGSFRASPLLPATSNRRSCGTFENADSDASTEHDSDAEASVSTVSILRGPSAFAGRSQRADQSFGAMSELSRGRPPRNRTASSAAVAVAAAGAGRGQRRARLAQTVRADSQPSSPVSQPAHARRRASAPRGRGMHKVQHQVLYDAAV